MMGLDPAAAAAICIRELYGDWFRDPWNWLELRWVHTNASKLSADIFVRADTSGGATLRDRLHFNLIEVSKNGLTVRL